MRRGDMVRLSLFGFIAFMWILLAVLLITHPSVVPYVEHVATSKAAIVVYVIFFANLAYLLYVKHSEKKGKGRKRRREESSREAVKNG